MPNPVDPQKKHVWKEGISQRAEAITDLVFADGTLFVAGLSNEEFAATLWRVPFPFKGAVAATTLENFHGAHGKYETESPIRAFVAYPLRGKQQILAAYLCTPLVTFPLEDLKEQYLRHAGQALKPSSVGRYRNSLANVLARIGAVRVSQISVENLLAYRQGGKRPRVN